jgi:molybdenum cofactor cytidylyltransferase
MSQPAIATIILAAGSSARLGMHKALLKIENESAIKRVVKTVLASRSCRCIAVLGAQAAAVRAELDNLPVEIIENKNYAAGRTGSLKCALTHLGPALESTAVVIFPVDYPFVLHVVIDQLIDSYLTRVREVQESFWIVPEFQAKRGHPVLLAGPVLTGILALSADFSLREYLSGASSDHSLYRIAMPVESEAVLDNINTKEDLLRIWKREEL